jgi:hypothetical protein
MGKNRAKRVKYKQMLSKNMTKINDYFQFFLIYAPKVRKNYLKRLRNLK